MLTYRTEEDEMLNKIIFVAVFYDNPLLRKVRLH